MPYDSFEIRTELDSDEVMRRITAATKQGSLFQKKEGTYLFFGQIEFRSFRLMRWIFYNNSFNPVIKGTVTDDRNGTVIDVEQSLHITSKIFMLVWFAFSTFALLVTLASVYLGMENGKRGLAISIIMLCGGMALIRVGFWLEARKTKGVLEDLLK